MNVFEVNASLKLQINKFVQQLNRASQLLESTLSNMSSAISSLNIQPVEIRTEADTSAVQDVEDAVTGTNVPPITIPTETERPEPVTIPPPDDRTFMQKIKDSFNNLKNMVNSIPSKIASVITSIPSKIGSGLKTIGANISNAFKSAVEKAKNALKELPEKATEALKETGEKLKGIAETVSKAGTVAIGAVSTAIGAFTKSSLDSYANYEQLTGGIETLFQNSADKVKGYADVAYKTAGLSANEYMETVTSFSASLLQSLGGDTNKAAEISDMAIRDMSDNANKMGSSMDNIKNAYQGFAKQNYTMLDNLKLGYGGTAREMARLINDSGVLGDALINLDDTQTLSLQIEEAGGYATIIKAINAVQTQMGITGTTSKEAASTIEGSVASMKSAWENLTVEIAKDNGNIDQLISYFVESVETAANNILPRIEIIFSGIGKLIQKFAPLITDKLPDIISTILPTVVSSATLLVASMATAITKSVPKLASSAVELLKGFAEDIAENAPEAIKGFSDMLNSVKDWIKKNGKALISVGMDMIKSIAKGISENLPDMVGSVTEIVTFIGEIINENIDDLLDSALAILGTLGQGIIDNLPELFDTALKIVEKLTTYISENLDSLLDGALKILGALAQGIIDNRPELDEAGYNIIVALGNYIIDKLPVLLDKAPEIIGSLATAFGECAGKMSEAADKLMTKFSESVGASQSWQEVKDSFSSAVDDIGESFKKLGESFDQKELEEAKKFFIYLKELIFGTDEQLGAIQHIIGLLIEILANTIKVIGDVISGFVNFCVWLEKGSAAANAVKFAIAALIGVIGSLFTPIAGIVTAIGMVIYAGKLIIENWDEIKTFCIGVWNEMQDRLIEFWENLAVGWHDIWQSITDFFKERIDDLKTGWQSIIGFFKECTSTGIQSIKDFFAGLRDHINTIFGAIGSFISDFVDNWKSGVDSIKEGVSNVIGKVKEIPAQFGELVDSAISWGKDMIENFISGIKEKASALWEEIQNIAQGVKDFLGFSEPDKGPLSNFHTFAPDMIALFVEGIKDNKKSIFSEINGIADSIKTAFEEPINVNTDITANGSFNRLRVPDISTVAENIYTVKSETMQDNATNENTSPVTVEHLTINIDGGTAFNSEYEMEKFINFVADRLQAREITKSRGTGGVFL